MKTSERQDYFWNTAAGIINAAEAVVMSMCVTRITDLKDAGILTIAFAVGNLMITIGKFGVRNFQVTDARAQYSFSTYLKSRIITVLLMLAATAAYLLYASARLNYESNKLYAILLICLIYALESLEDVFWGYYQIQNHLAVGAMLFTFRWIAILVTFLIALLVTRNLVVTLLICFIVSIVVFLLLLSYTYPRICSEEDRGIKKLLFSKEKDHKIRSLFYTTFPLFGSTFLAFYVSNAPKYAIDACLSDEVQACYGFVAMPVFVVGLLSNFIYQPVLIHMATEWKEGRKDKITNRIKKQMMVIFGLFVVCITGAYILGIPGLSLLYHTDLTDYKMELMILMVASGFWAVSSYFGVVLTIMRCQKEMLAAYSVVAVLAFLSLNTVVSLYGTVGAAIAYMILMLLLCVFYGILLIIHMRK
ncbi:MAG: oligosaccharide flippase family protein [Clostridiales bacterium]|nr:oligosaccharide flippase family protein [Clostridiales bacterium]MCC8107024.1 oligosaccharide flippase family protein [Clostridiales bacterium]